MNKSAALFLQLMVVLVGIAALFLLLHEPQIEGRNAHATQFEIYFNDPFLVYAYTAAIPVFVALYQAFKVLGHVRQGNSFSPGSVKAMRTIKHCAMAVIGFLVGGEAWLFLYMSGKDDIAGGVAIGLFFILVFTGTAAIAAMFERHLRNAVAAAP